MSAAVHSIQRDAPNISSGFPPLTTESPTTHYCTVQHHVPIDPYAEQMPRAALTRIYTSRPSLRRPCALVRAAGQQPAIPARPSARHGAVQAERRRAGHPLRAAVQRARPLFNLPLIGTLHMCMQKILSLKYFTIVDDQNSQRRSVNVRRRSAARTTLYAFIHSFCGGFRQDRYVSVGI